MSKFMMEILLESWLFILLVVCVFYVAKKIGEGKE